jgi:predicted MFS family arabinose efflux permease
MIVKWTPPLSKLAIAWLTMFLVGTELFVLSPLLPIIAKDLNISSVVAGFSVTVFSLTYMVSAPLFGYLADRIGRQSVLMYSLLAFGAANLITAAAPNLPSLLAVRLFAGAAAAGISPSIYALVGSAAPPDRRGSWMAVVVSGLLGSLAFGASIGTVVGAFFGWAPVFVALAVFSFALALLNCRVWHWQGLPTGIAEAPASDPLVMAVLVRRLVPMAVWSTGLYCVYTYLGIGLCAVGFSTGQTATAILCYGCGAIAGALIGGRVTDWLGAKFTASFSLAGLCGCLLLLRLAMHTDALVAPALGLSSAVGQLFFPAQQAGLANDFPGRRCTALAWNNSALFFGISLGSLIGGRVVAIGNFEANLMVSAGIVLAGCIINAIVVPGSWFSPARRGCAKNPSRPGSF